VAAYALIAGIENFNAGVLRALRNAMNGRETGPRLSRKRTHLQTRRGSVFSKGQVRLSTKPTKPGQLQPFTANRDGEPSRGVACGVRQSLQREAREDVTMV
jgi:hypothetical protein